MAATATNRLIGPPLIGRLSSDAATHPATLYLLLARKVTKAAGRLDAKAASRTALLAGQTAVKPLPMLGSANLMDLLQADDVMLLPAKATEIGPREVFPFVRF